MASSDERDLNDALPWLAADVDRLCPGLLLSRKNPDDLILP